MCILVFSVPPSVPSSHGGGRPLHVGARPSVISVTSGHLVTKRNPTTKELEPAAVTPFSDLNHSATEATIRLNSFVSSKCKGNALTADTSVFLRLPTIAGTIPDKFRISAEVCLWTTLYNQTHISIAKEFDYILTCKNEHLLKY